MSESEAGAARPWHADGAENPFEAIYQHFEQRMSGQATSAEISSLKAEIAALEQRLAGARAPVVPPVADSAVVMPPAPPPE